MTRVEEVENRIIMAVRRGSSTIRQIAATLGETEGRVRKRVHVMAKDGRLRIHYAPRRTMASPVDYPAASDYETVRQTMIVRLPIR